MRDALTAAVKHLLSVVHDARAAAKRKTSRTSFGGHGGAKAKLVLIGAGHSGKTALACALAGKVFPREYEPTLFDIVDANDADAVLWDTPGAPPYDLLRPLCYTGAAAILLCVALDRPDETEVSKAEQWRQELRKGCPRVPVVIVGKLPKKAHLNDIRCCRRDQHVIVMCCFKEVAANLIVFFSGTKADLKENGTRGSMVDEVALELLAESVNADVSIECSAMTGFGVDDVLATALAAAADGTSGRRWRRRCGVGGRRKRHTPPLPQPPTHFLLARSHSLR